MSDENDDEFEDNMNQMVQTFYFTCFSTPRNSTCSNMFSSLMSLLWVFFQRVMGEFRKATLMIIAAAGFLQLMKFDNVKNMMI